MRSAMCQPRASKVILRFSVPGSQFSVGRVAFGYGCGPFFAADRGAVGMAAWSCQDGRCGKFRLHQTASIACPALSFSLTCFSFRIRGGAASCTPRAANTGSGFPMP